MERSAHILGEPRPRNEQCPVAKPAGLIVRQGGLFHSVAKAVRRGVLKEWTSPSRLVRRCPEFLLLQPETITVQGSTPSRALSSDIGRKGLRPARQGSLRSATWSPIRRRDSPSQFIRSFRHNNKYKKKGPPA